MVGAAGSPAVGVVVRVGLGLLAGALHGVVEGLLVDACLVEGVAAATVRQREAGRDPHVLLRDRFRSPPRGVRGRGAGDDEVGAHPVDVERGAHRGDAAQLGVGQHHGADPGLRIGDAGGRRTFGGRPGGGEAARVVVEREPPPHDLGPRCDVARRPHLDREPEPVQQLRPQLALLRVHRADQQEPGRVRHRHAVAFDVRPTHGGGVEEGVDEVVVQEVDLVDVEHPAVGVGEQTGLVGADALGQRALQVERADEPVFGRADRQLDQPGRVPGGHDRRVRPVRAVGVGRGGVAAEPASHDDVQVGQQGGQRAHGRRLRRALLAPHQHTADARVHRVEQQGEAQVVVADHGAERERARAHHRETARPDVITGRSAGAP